MDEVSIVDVEELSTAMETSRTDGNRIVTASADGNAGTRTTVAGGALASRHTELSIYTCKYWQLFPNGFVSSRYLWVKLF